MTKIDFDKIRRENPLPDVIRNSGVNLTKDGNEFRACCMFHGEKSPSFSAYLPPSGTWQYHCFGCGVHGDVIDYVKERYGYASIGDAARFLTGEDSNRNPVSTAQYKESTNSYDGYDVIKPPAGTAEIIAGVRTPPLLNPKRVNPENGKAKVVTYTPKMAHAYRNKAGDLLGYVLRVEFDDKKITPGIWWTVNKKAGFEGWSHGSYPEPRPMYGLELLYAFPDYQVLIVEGEKCADAANKVFQEIGAKVVAVSWMGGGKALAKTYWKSLRGRSIIIWPDNDAEGWKTVLGYARPGGSWAKGIYEYCMDSGAVRVKIVHITPNSRPEGWDIADALNGTKEADYADSLSAKAIAMMIRERVEPWDESRHAAWKALQIEKEMPQGNEPGPVERAEDNAPDAEPEKQEPEAVKPQQAAEPAAAPVDDQESEATEVVEVGRGFSITDENWRQHLIMKADGDGLKPNSAMNIALILQYERRFSGIFAWNEFANEVYLMRRPPWDISGRHAYWRNRKLKETDITACSGWLEYTGMSPKMSDVGRIIVRVAEHNKYNPVIDSLEALKWDGTPRVSGKGLEALPWLCEYLGADDTDANRMFGEKWLIGAVARAMDPGCKMDTMLVIEGDQGLQKSTALRILSDGVCPGVFTDEISDPNSKDAALQMQGAFIIEIAELDAFRRAEVTQIKSWLARQKDRFRRPYGKVVEDFPRSCVFAGTVNPLANQGYLKDATGGRRFWPVEAKHIDIQRLQADAPQIWAEAVHLYKTGVKWWFDRGEDVVAQEVQSSRYEDDPYGELIDNFVRGKAKAGIHDIMENLGIPTERRNGMVTRRVSSHLLVKGWKRLNEDGAISFQNPKIEPKKEPKKDFFQETIPDVDWS